MHSWLEKEKVLVPTYQEKEKKTFEISINRAYLRNAAAMIAAIVLFLSLIHIFRWLSEPLFLKPGAKVSKY